MRAVLGSTIFSVVTMLVACSQSGASVPGFGAPPGGDRSAGDAAAETGNGSLGAGIDGGTGGGPGFPGTDGSGSTGGDGASGSGPATPGADGSVPPIGTPLGPHATAGKLMLDIGGTTQGIDYAFLKVDGTAKLGGELHLTFAPGFVPKSGQRFIVVTAAGGVSGAFASITTSGVALTSGQDATTFYVTVN